MCFLQRKKSNGETAEEKDARKMAQMWSNSSKYWTKTWAEWEKYVQNKWKGVQNDWSKENNECAAVKEQKEKKNKHIFNRKQFDVHFSSTSSALLRRSQRRKALWEKMFPFYGSRTRRTGTQTLYSFNQVIVHLTSEKADIKYTMYEKKRKRAKEKENNDNNNMKKINNTWLC